VLFLVPIHANSFSQYMMLIAPTIFVIFRATTTSSAAPANPPINGISDAPKPRLCSRASSSAISFRNAIPKSAATSSVPAAAALASASSERYLCRCLDTTLLSHAPSVGR